MDPVLMQQLDKQYGRMEWRLPEAHAIYWASEGLDRATNHLSRVTEDDLMPLRRVIYQCMQLTWQRGRIVDSRFSSGLDFGPNLDMIPAVNDSYLSMYQQETDPNQKQGVLKAHRNFLRQAIYSLYVYNRTADAAKWFKYLGEQYPDKTIIDGDMNSFPRNVTLDRYVVAAIQEDINDMSRDKMRTVIEGLLIRSYTGMILDQDEHAAGLKNLARQAWQTYQNKIPAERQAAIGLPPFADIDRDIRDRMLDPNNGLPAEARAILRTKLGLPAEKAQASTAPPAETPNTKAP
jgi:hypothetical protein